MMTKEIVPSPTQKEVENAIKINLLRDPSDIPVALCAIKAKVDYLITRDKDFVSLDETTKEIRKRINIIKPQVFLEKVMGWNKESLEKLSRRRWQDLE